MALNKLIASSIVATTAAATSTAVTSDSSVRKQIALQVTLTGTVTNTTLDLSVCTIDDNGVESWQAKKTVAVRTPPSGSKIVDLAVFDIYGVLSVKVALETAVTGGGTASVLYAFA